MMKTTNFITLPDGRKLAYAEFGQPDGYPVIYFHGNPSCRLEPLLLSDELIGQFNLRLIAFDRPGIGQSDPHPDRGFSDCPQDVAFLADALELAKFSVLGFSAGGGYVCACAAKIPHRLINAVIVSGAWDMNVTEGLPMLTRWIFKLTKPFPVIPQVMLKLILPLYKNPKKTLVNFKKQFPAADYAALSLPQRIEAYCQSTIESTHQSTQGFGDDVQLYFHPWDFNIAEIQIPLTFFHGEQDRTVSISMAKRAIDRLPTAKFLAYPNEGHISIIINQFESIVQALKSDRSD
jgi:pimeloyl-ACP methyl ester carboxylesterase